jgi:hypothetical protein
VVGLIVPVLNIRNIFSPRKRLEDWQRDDPVKIVAKEGERERGGVGEGRSG